MPFIVAIFPIYHVLFYSRRRRSLACGISMGKVLHYWLASLLVGFCLPAPAAWTESTQTQWHKADAKSFHYTGRIDFSRPGEAGLIWQASKVATQFKGDYLAIGFADLQGQVYFDLHLDGKVQLLEARNGWTEIPM